MSTTKQRQQLIRRGVGASEVAAVAGLNPWKQPIDVWLSRFEPEDSGSSYLARRGQLLEPGLIKLLGEQLGCQVVPNRKSVVCADDPLCFATPDGYVEGLPVDVKMPGPRTWHEWVDEDGDPIVPVQYVCQIAWQTRATGKPRGLIAADLGDRLFFRWLPRDPQLETMLVESVQEFWAYVERKEPPPPQTDDTYAVGRYLDARHPRSGGQLVRIGADQQADNPIVSAAYEGIRARKNKKIAEERYHAAQTRAKELLADSPGFEIEGLGRLTWTNNKDREMIKWEKLAKQLLGKMPDDQAAKLMAEYTETIAGPRVLRFPTGRAAKEIEEST